MGIVLGRFRKKRTTIEVLEDLDKSIKEMEKRRASTEQTHRVVIGRLMLYSVGAYVIAAVVFYFFFFPASLSEQIFYITPLLVFPLIVVLVRRGIVWHFKRQITNSETKLTQMEKQKQDILEEVMDKETYKTAKQILERFAPKKELAVVSPLPAKSSASNQMPGSISPTSTGSDLRRRPLGRQQQQMQQQQQQRSPESFQPPKTSLVPRGRSPTLLQSAPVLVSAPMVGRYPGGYTGQNRLSPGPPLPRPIAPRERSVVDRLVDFLIADGPSNRFALICQQCQSHNGLALKEEFDFVAFRCCYCYTMNPARKVRLSPPRIDGIDNPPVNPGAASVPSLPPPRTTDSSEGPTDSESERLSRSDSSSEDEEGEKKLLPSLSSVLPTEEGLTNGDRPEIGDKEEAMKKELQESNSVPPLPAENGEKQLPLEEAHKIEELAAAD